MHPTAVALARAALFAHVLAACGGSSEPTSSRPPTVTPPDPDLAACATRVVSLAPGTARALDDAESRCFSVPADGADYVLAFYDTRSLTQARDAPNSPEPDGGASLTIVDRSAAAHASVTLDTRSSHVATDRASPPPTASSRTPIALGRTSDIVPVVAASVAACATGRANDVLCRDRPWTLGERFVVSAGTDGLPRLGDSATVIAIRGPFVLALFDRERRDSAAYRVALTRTADVFLRDVLPRVRSALSPNFPTTSAASGQLLVAAGDFNLSYTLPSNSATESHAMILLGTIPEEIFPMQLALLAHETTHAFQFQYKHESRSDATRPSAGGDRWAMEGGAVIMEQESVRRLAGVALTGNLTTEPLTGVGTGTSTDQVYGYLLQRGQGDILRGYYDAASMLRDFMIRLVRRGATDDDALADISRGVLDGWYGVDLDRQHAEGLVARMQRRLGADWDPVDAIFTWTLSAALDERGSARFDAAAIRDAQRYWHPSASITSWSGATATALKDVAGAAGYVTIRGDARGGTLQLTQNGGAMRLMLARVP